MNAYQVYARENEVMVSWCKTKQNSMKACKYCIIDQLSPDIFSLNPVTGKCPIFSVCRVGYRRCHTAKRTETVFTIEARSIFLKLCETGTFYFRKTGAEKCSEKFANKKLLKP